MNQTKPRHETDKDVQKRTDSLSSKTVTAIVVEYLLSTKNNECNPAVLNGKSKLPEIITRIFSLDR